MKTTNTARTGMEQMLVSNAVDQSLNKIDFQPFAGRTVFLEEKYLDSVDSKYVASSIRHRMMKSGARLAAKAEEAEVVVEVRSGGIGTDTSDSFLGIPEITLPGMVTLPEVRFLTRKQQSGIAKIGLVAYDAKTKQALGTGGMSLAKADDNNLYILGVGPWQDGSVRSEVSNGVATQRGSRRSAVGQTVAFTSPSGIMTPPPTQTGKQKLQFASESKIKQMSGTMTDEYPRPAANQNQNGSNPWYLK